MVILRGQHFSGASRFRVSRPGAPLVLVGLLRSLTIKIISGRVIYAA